MIRFTTAARVNCLRMRLRKNGIELSTRPESTLNEEQIEMLHKLLDCVSDTAAAEMRAAYKIGFKDGMTLIRGTLE